MIKRDQRHVRPLQVRGAAENNLKGVSIDLPNGKLIAVVGASGAGKSTLVHQVIARIGRRRLGRLRGEAHSLAPSYEPKVASVEGLFPCIEVRQAPLRGNIRSTIATYTGILDLLALLYMHHGESRSPGGFAVEELDRTDFGNWLLRHYPEESVTLARISPNVQLFSVAQLPKSERIFFREENGQWRQGTREALKRLLPTRLWLAVPEQRVVIKGRASVEDLVRKPSRGWLWVIGHNVYIEGGFHRIAADDPEPYLPLDRKLFSFNSVALGSGRCETCDGHGVIRTVYEGSLVVAPHVPLLSGGLNLPKSGERFTHLGVLDCILRAILRLNGLPEDVSWSGLPEHVRQIVLHGSGDKPLPELRPGDTRLTKPKRPFPGLISLITNRAQSGGPAAKVFQHLITEQSCPQCGGSRYNRSARTGIYRGMSLSDAMIRLTIGELHEAVQRWIVASQQQERRLLTSLEALISIYLNLKLGYLQLCRSTSTLSGGEAQRIKLGLALALQLSGCCYLLDEPSRALHAQDVADLARSVKRLCDGNNTVVIVEHNPILFRIADHLVALGPGGGSAGGKVVYEGNPHLYDGVETNEPEHHSSPGFVAQGKCVAIHVSNLFINNVRGVKFSVPVGRLTAVIGVSGAGKSSAILHGLVPAVQATLSGTLSTRQCSVCLPKGIRFVEVVSQKPPTQSRSSVIATSLEIYDQIRNYYARQDLSRTLGLKASDFSFNSNGACTACEGTGVARDGFGNETEETCHVCGGKRLAGLPLLVRVGGLTIVDLLDKTAEELARSGHPALDAESLGRLQLMTELGLGHLQLSRPTVTLSSGERQRLRIARFMAQIESSQGQGLMVLDEPTAGLSGRDARRVFDKLAELARASGHSMVVIEHKLDLLPSTDWIIEFGPGGGPAGGQVIFEGTYSQLLQANTPSAQSIRASTQLRSAASRDPEVRCLQVPSKPENPVRAAKVFESFIVNQEVWEDEQVPRPLCPTIKLDPARYPEDVRVGELLDLLPLLRVRCTPTLCKGAVGLPDLSSLENAVGRRSFGFSPVSFQRRLGLVTPVDITNALKQLQRLGFSRVWYQGKYLTLPVFARTARNREEPTDCWVICEADLETSIRQTALRWSQGVIRVMEGPDEGTILTTRFLLVEDNAIAQIGVLLSDPRVGDCRSPNGRCAYCNGTGRLMVFPLDLIIADPSCTIEQDRFWHPALLKAIRALRRARIIPEARFFAKNRVADFLRPYRAMTQQTAFLFEHGIPWRRFLKPGAKRKDRVQDYFSWRGLHDYVYMVYGRIADQCYKQQLRDGFQWQVCPRCQGTGTSWETAHLILKDTTLLQLFVNVPLRDIYKAMGVKTPALEAAVKLGLGHLKVAERFADLVDVDRWRLLIAAASGSPLENVTLLASGTKLINPDQISPLLAKQGMSIATLVSS
jgi:excinuclease ABC A subunit